MLSIESAMRWPSLLGLSMRRYDVDRDRETCLAHYRLNQHGRFPPDVEKCYEQTLSQKDEDHFVIEHEGRVVASCLITASNTGLYTFGYGLVHPDFQGKGIGTLMFYARLAMLPQPERLAHIFIYAVAASMPYYRRFGFEQSDVWKDEQGDEHPAGSLWVSGPMIVAARDFLERVGLELPPPGPGGVCPPSSPEVQLVWDENGQGRIEAISPEAKP
ncbi:MAG: GNAT family N-acetyltransferase [Verrucomicrobiaceae bacterium]|nr:GNAT family N-acetyltransferase [Verrucomicrobiaceae bacterium]